MPLPKAITEYESVATWASGLREQWECDPLAEDPEKLESLEAFCEFVGKDPDQLVAFCFLRRKLTGERFASVKRRRDVAQELRDFCDRSGHSGQHARRVVNDVLSFLIYNGVLIHPGMV